MVDAKPRRKRWLRRTVLALLIVIVLAYAAFALPPILKLGLRNYLALWGSTPVQAVRVHAPRMGEYAPTVRIEGPVLSRRQAERLRSLLTRLGSEPPLLLGTFIGAKRCFFHPGVDFVATSNERELFTVTLCFSCRMYQVASNGAVRTGDFDRSETELRELVAELFPNDPVATHSP